MKYIGYIVSWIKGDQELPLTRQLHSLAAFCAALFSVITVVANISLGLIDEMLLFSFLLVGSGFLIWYLSSRTIWSMQNIKLITLMIVSWIVIVAWFLFSGSQGFTPVIMFWMTGLIILFENRRTQWAVFLYISTLVISLYLIEFIRPHWINQYYASERERILDLLVSFGLGIIGLGFMIIVLSRIYRETQSRLIEIQMIQAEEEVKEHEARLEMTRRMSRGLAHDLKNVLMVINNSSDFIEQTLSEQGLMADEVIEDLKAIKESTEVASRLSRRLLDHSLNYDYPAEPLSLADIIRSQSKLIERISNQVHLIVEVCAEPVILGYLSDIEQVLMNLTLNAIQAMKGVGELKITINSEAKMGLIEVSDNGPGIPLPIQELIYEPLFTTKADSGGTGVGLNTVKKIIHRANGTISFMTSSNGTTFTVKWPLSDGDEITDLK